MPNSKVGLGFNRSQTGHVNNKVPGHPESPQRIEIIEERLRESGILERCVVVESVEVACDEMDIRQSHDKDYVAKMLNLDEEDFKSVSESFDSVFLSKGSINAAKEAASLARELSRKVTLSELDSAFAFVRPPGHHADADSACGFCIFNNAAQAAEAAFDYGADRVLIVDLDVHHGQGTQRIFYDDKRVLYFSIHRHEHGKFWPHLRESDVDFIGEGAGKGYNVNVPLNETGCGDVDYMWILFHVLLPVATQFNPDLVILSAGFDSCDGDPLGGMALSVDGYSHFVYHLRTLANAKLLLLLEGGYHHIVGAEAALRCVRVLCGMPPLPIEISKKVKQSVLKACRGLMTYLRPYWSCFNVLCNEFDTNKYEHLYTPPQSDDVVNTGHVSQNDLTRFEWNDSCECTSSKTEIFYNEKDELHYCVEDDEHPECPERTRQMLERLREDYSSSCTFVESTRSATEIELTRVHNYVPRIASTATMSEKALRSEEDRLDSIFITSHTNDVARRAVGAVLDAVDSVMSSSQPTNAFVVVRPPGHHAGIDKPSGFCIFNNVAVAAKYAQSEYGNKRIVILDFDVHHGNGTQEIFVDDPSVLYISLHRHDDGVFYPMGEPKNCTDVGEGNGRGFTVNVALNGRKVGDTAYVAAFQQVVLPIATEFKPDLVFISAGFDAADGDPLGGYRVSPETFAWMTYHLHALARGKLLAVLEGGYNVDVICDCASAVVGVLNGDVPQLNKDARNYKLQGSVLQTLQQTITAQAPFWSSVSGFEVKESTKQRRRSARIAQRNEMNELEDAFAQMKT